MSPMRGLVVRVHDHDAEYEYEETTYFEAHNTYFLLAAFLLDLKEFYYVARYVVCVLPWWLPMVEADLRPR